MKTLIIGILFSALFPMGVYPQISQDTIPVKNKNKEVVNYISFEKGFKNGFWYGTKDKVFYDTSVTNEAKKFCLDSPMSFYGDIALNPFVQANYTSTPPQNFHLNHYGSSDVVNTGNSANKIDWQDYNAILGSTSDRADLDGIGGPGQIADKQMLLDYLTDNAQRPYLPAHWDYLQNRNERISWFEKVKMIDQTQVYHPGWNCDDYSMQFQINTSGVENILASGLGSVYNISQNARFNIPVYIVDTETNTNITHAINCIYIGDSTGNFNSVYFYEPQNDQRVYPGSPSMGANSFANIARYSYFWSQFLNQYVYGNLSLVNFDLQGGQVISTTIPLPETVLYRTLKNVHLHGNKPLNVTVNWVNGQADTLLTIQGGQQMFCLLELNQLALIQQINSLEFGLLHIILITFGEIGY
jgi:hypothetical protein